MILFLRSFCLTKALRTAAALIALPGFAAAPLAAAEPALLDDFSDARSTLAGGARVLVDDQQLGSQSHGTQTCAEGVLTVEGSLVPGRGVPAFMSLALLTTPDGQPKDLSAFEGILLRVKLTQGMLSVQAAASKMVANV